MKTLSQKSKVIAATAVIGLMFSLSARAEQNDVEQMITNAVVAQSQVLVSQMSMQLQASIKQQLTSFSLNSDVLPMQQQQVIAAKRKLASNTSTKTAEEE